MKGRIQASSSLFVLYDNVSALLLLQGFLVSDWIDRLMIRLRVAT